MVTMWVLVANASEAKLFTLTKKTASDLTLVEQFSHPASREKGLKLASDRFGHYQSKSTGHGTFVEQTSLKRAEAERFAKELADQLNAGRTANKYEKLFVIVPAHFRGLLKKYTNKNVQQLVSDVVDKDYTHVTEKELANILKNHFAL